MLNCYCQLSSSVIFRQYGVSQSESKIDRPRPGLLTLPQSLTLLLTQRTMGMPRGVLLGTVESCVEKLAE